MYVENPREWIKNHGLSKNITFLLGLVYNEVVFLSYQLSTFILK